MSASTDADRTLSTLLACPLDRSDLESDGSGWRCRNGGHSFGRGDHGYLELARPGSPVLTIESTSSECAHIQESGGERVYREYLADWLRGPRGGTGLTVLDAGSGTGTAVAEARRDGHCAVGLDMSAVAAYWRAAGRPADQFVVGSVTEMPFADDAFDVAWTLGVMEHVGTTTGHLTLASDWRQQRAEFARELLRVVRPGGRILMACPNKSFPLDIQHGPTDEQTQAPLRARIFDRFGVNVHQVWGSYHLPSYRDVDRWFGRERVRPLPLASYFGFSALERPGVPQPAARAARWWVESMPPALRRTGLNPYVLVEIVV
ncbi:class I SAM-dependent methyltransferase [Nakamurella sp.]|uniref:class I SAM-dependent methyltransferase n=1 Tax=Nakamurella sp. TaxID=1869182 RepID=UPI00378402A9